MGEGEGGEFPPKKAQSDTVSSSSTEYPAKKLARQLDFTGGIGGSVVLPEHPQSQAAVTQTVAAAAAAQPQPQTQSQLVMPGVASQPPHTSVRVV